MLNSKFFVALFLLFVFQKSKVFGMSLWDQVVKKEHVFLTVEYEKRYLNVWRQDSHGYSKFYVTPLCVMEIDSISCTFDEYSNIHRHIFGFNLKLWDSKAAKVVQNALKQKNVTVSLSDILPLPMQMVRVGLGGKDLIVDTNNQWTSNQDQPHLMPFEFYTRHEKFCNKMISDAKNNTEHFLRGIKPYFEFTMVMGQHETRKFNLTGKTLQKSEFFANLVNKHADKNGIVYLQSKDLNRLTRDLYNKAFWDEEVSAAYIPSTQEKEIINELLEIFKNQQIQSKDLTENEWNSVFWDDIFARPDIQTNYANEVLKYDEKERSFKYDKEKDHQFRKNIEKMRNSNNKDVTAAEGGFTFFGLFEAEAGGISSSENYKNAKNNENIETASNFVESYIDSDLQYLFFHKRSFIKAEGVCHGLNGHLVTINSMFENMFLNEKAKRIDVSSDTYWIGATDTIKAQTWSWMDNSSLAFNNWVKGQPQNTFESNCGAGLMQGGKWISDNCNKQKPFICEFKDATDAPTKLNSPVCPVSWTFYNTTGFCYKVMDNATWKGAETRCKAENAHLASVHSIEESLILADLAYYPGVHGCTWPTHAWIGLFTEDRNVHWNWTDKTPYNYAKWMPGHPNPPEINQNCGYIYLAPCTTTKTGDFDNAPCERVLPKFICKKQP